MMKLKVIEIKVKPYDDYATVTEVYENMSAVHHSMLKNTAKNNYPYVRVRQDLPPYKTLRVRLDKIGLTEENTKGEYSYYFDERELSND